MNDAEAAVLVPGRPEHAAVVVGWVRSSPYSRPWLGAGGDDEAILARWAALDGATQWVLETASGTPVAYGEVWVEPEEDEAELAHLVVDPARRGEGFGRELVARLGAYAAELAALVALRVDPDNTHAQAVYAGCGYERFPAAEEAAFNEGQPAAYVWMRRVAPAP